MSHIRECLNKLKSKSESLVGDESLQEDMQDLAEKIVQKLLKEIKVEAGKLASKHKISINDTVRTTSDGVKQLDYALEIFVREFLKEETSGSSPVVTLEY
jgi:hypothetical protein